MKKSEIKKKINYLLKKDLDFSNDCYTEWEYYCNVNKAKVDEKGKITKIRKYTYNEVCKETIEEAMGNLPSDITKWSEEEVEIYLEKELFALFKKHNNSAN